ncbi:MAG: peptidoglycan DD-metalloendopeptidase family protein [Candidatus Spechtbacteria bacterium]|nr:peptidoglycan DD-metalloendopeptidase family protein [Candidatus Spechtbacteria bacterium]
MTQGAYSKQIGREVTPIIIDNLGPRQGGPVVARARANIGTYSLVFLGAVRNSNVNEASVTRESYGTFYGEGPEDATLPSIGESSLLKQSSPLGIFRGENERRDIITYRVKEGDTPLALAASFGITLNTLLWANNLSYGQYIKAGDDLMILPISGVRYKVRAGDTISSIASRLKGDIFKILEFNELNIEDSIQEGEYLIVPDGEMPSISYKRNDTPRYSPPLVNLDNYFIHPTAGIGYRSRGIHPHNAVDWAAPCWTKVYAAAEGSVAIADSVGWNGGYGKYVKINHPNGTQTVYGHAIQILAKAGQYVQQGELIEYMGSTGRSTGCHVHWEVYGALNPLR